MSLMLPSTSTYKFAIHRPHKLAFEVDLYDGPGGDLIASNVPILGGSISATLTHRVTRSGTFTVGPEYWPSNASSAASAASVLTPYRTVANVRAGIEYGDGSREVFDIITGRVGEISRSSDGLITARVDDLAADVIGFRFEEPRNSDNVGLIPQIHNLIREALPAATFGVDDVDDSPTPKLTWDEDRGQALDNLAEALGARWYTLGNGEFVIRKFPYDVGQVVQIIRDEENGLMIEGEPMITRDNAANSVTVTVERFDGGEPFRVTARDFSPTSPTFFNGPFGRVSRLIKIQTPITISQATTLARAQLNASTALFTQWSVAMIPDYTLEPGDTVQLHSRGVQNDQLIDSITYPLSPGTMSLSTRAYIRAQDTLD